jgi:hypothetical protein
MMDINDIKEKGRNSKYKISFTHTEKTQANRRNSLNIKFIGIAFTNSIGL